MNKAKLLKLARLLREPVQDEVPEGYFSRDELQDVYNETKENTCKIIKRFMKNYPAKITMKKLRIKNTAGTISIIPYYKIKE